MIPSFPDNGLSRGLNYNYRYPDRKFSLPNSIADVKVDNYYIAKRFASSKVFITMSLWTVVVDAEGSAYGIYSNQIGDYHYW